MNLYGATVCARFDGSDPRIKNTMNIKHEDYSTIPKELLSLQQELNQRYSTIYPIEFRGCHALEQFELMGILTHYEDAINLVLELEEKLTDMHYQAMITAGFGTVLLPKDYLNMKPIDVLNRVVGHGVYSAFQYYKKKFKKDYPYFFYSYHHNYNHFNVQRKTLEKRKETLQQELRELQKVDEETQRDTYYLNHVFSEETTPLKKRKRKVIPMDVFEVVIHIETDGDFSYEGKRIKLAIALDFEDAVDHMEKRIKKIISTIKGKEHVVSEVKRELIELLERFEVEIDFEEEEYRDEFDIGNQTGFFEIRKLKQEHVDDIIMYTEN